MEIFFMKKRILTVLMLLVLLVSCFEQEKWTAFVYPDIENIPYAYETKNYTIGDFDTLEECKNAAKIRINFNYMKTGKNGDYECGLNCNSKQEYNDNGLLLCKDVCKDACRENSQSRYK